MPNETVCQFISPQRRLPWSVLLICMALVIVWPMGLVSFDAHQRLQPFARLTGGLINSTMLGYLLEMFVVWVILVRWGGLSTSDLGLDWSKLKTGVALIIALWMLIQIGQAAICLNEGRPVSLHPLWSTHGVTVVVGLLIAQLFGNALFEEMLFRHLFVSQWHERLRFVKWPAVRLVGVLVGVQIFFALIHIPNRLAGGMTAAELSASLVISTLSGLGFAWMYLQTRNLFFAVGVHALRNEPANVFAQEMSSRTLLDWIVGTGLIVHLLILVIKARRCRQCEQSIVQQSSG